MIVTGTHFQIYILCLCVMPVKCATLVIYMCVWSVCDLCVVRTFIIFIGQVEWELISQPQTLSLSSTGAATTGYQTSSCPCVRVSVSVYLCLCLCIHVCVCVSTSVSFCLCMYHIAPTTCCNLQYV